MLASVHYYAADPVAIGYVAIILAIWLISTIRGLARRARQRSSTRGRTVTLRAAGQRQAPPGVRIGDTRITAARRARSSPAAELTSAAAPAAPIAPLPPEPEAPPLALTDATATTFGTIDRSQTASPAPLGQRAHAPILALLDPMTMPLGIASAVVAAAIIGPCVAYRAHADELIGW